MFKLHLTHRTQLTNLQLIITLDGNSTSIYCLFCLEVISPSLMLCLFTVAGAQTKIRPTVGIQSGAPRCHWLGREFWWRKIAQVSLYYIFIKSTLFRPANCLDKICINLHIRACNTDLFTKHLICSDIQY